MKEIKTSVIVPVYNTEAYIEECIESILGQTQKEIEIIVVDDGSTDGSMAIVEHYQQLYDNIHSFKQKNQGQGAARNLGVHVALGEYIYFLDSDDFIEPDTLECCYQCAKENDLDLVLFDASVLVEEGVDPRIKIGKYDRRSIIKEVNCKFTGRTFLEKYMEREPDIVSPCMMYLKKKFIECNELEFLQDVVHEDEEYRFRLMMAEPILMYVPKLFYYRRYRSGSTMTSNMKERRLFDYIYVVNKMIQVANGYDTLAMKYIARKMWLAFVRYKQLEKKEESESLYEELCKLFVAYSTKRMAYLGEKEQILYQYQEQQLLMKSRNEKDANLIEMRNSIVADVLKELPLEQKGKVVGIYGIGPHTEKLLMEYERLVGEIGAEIIFIDSNRKSFTKYRDKDVYNIADLDNIVTDEIIISSFMFEKELVEKVHEIYGNKYKIKRFYDRHPFVLFDLL